MAAVVYTELRKYVPLLASGKVRELYDLGASELLFVTTDRISGIDLIICVSFFIVPKKKQHSMLL